MSRQSLVQALAAVGADFRPRPLTPACVEGWIEQFPAGSRDDILRELTYVLRRTYFSRDYFLDYFRGLVRHKSLTDPAKHWKNVRFLRLQQFGNSQNDLLNLFDQAMREGLGFGIDDCGSVVGRYVYLDDVLFSGGRIKSDLKRWIAYDAPNNARVDVLLLARHTQGSFFSEKEIAETATVAGKNIAVRFLARFLIEDRKARTNVSDVLRPSAIPSGDMTRSYVQALGVEPKLRDPGNVGGHGFFSSEAGRHLLEQEFLRAGVRVRQKCPLLKAQHRPLGCTVQRTPGFGSTIITYRNCPNNAPLALWAGAPWHPLFPRETN